MERERGRFVNVGTKGMVGGLVARPHQDAIRGAVRGGRLDQSIFFFLTRLGGHLDFVLVLCIDGGNGVKAIGGEKRSSSQKNE